jgi:hypothetical protein
MHAIETTGRIDDRRSLHLDEDLPVESQGRVRVIILSPDSDEMTEQEWLKAAASNPVFDFLKDPAQDIYTLEDGEPFDPNDVDAR